MGLSEVEYWGRVKVLDEDGVPISFSSSAYAQGIKDGTYWVGATPICLLSEECRLEDIDPKPLNNGGKTWV